MNEGGSMADNFENSWKEALNRISIEPDARLWEGIDRRLANHDVIYFKRKLAIYKWVAVIAMLMAMTVTLLDYSGLFNENNYLSSQYSDTFLAKLVEPEFVFSADQTISFGLRKSNRKIESNGFDGSNYQSGAKEHFSGNRIPPILVSELLEKRMPEFHQLAMSRPDEQHIYLMPNLTARSASNKNKSLSTDDKFWAGVGVGSSTFDPNYQLNQPDEVLTSLMSTASLSQIGAADLIGSAESSYTDNLTQGNNYQLGLNMGMMVGNRLTLESGFAYAQSQLTSQTDRITQNQLFATSVASKENLGSTQASARQDVVNYTREELNLNNTFQFASVPVKAGYMILDRKVNLKINAGVIANIYMGSTIAGLDESGSLLDLTPGSSSPYRTVSFLGTTGISVGYNFMDNFDLIIEPNYSQALQPLTKVESDFNAIPAGFGMMAGLRYRFRQ
jgi:hypothetical protein